MYNSVSIDQPHNPGTWVSGDTDTESSWITLLHSLGFQFAHKDRLGSRLGVGINLVGHPVRKIEKLM